MQYNSGWQTIKISPNIAESFDIIFVNIGPSLANNTRYIPGKTFQMYLNKTMFMALNFQLID